MQKDSFMIFKVENLGVIAKAEVDLSKDLILLTGQNNTGKTYLAYAIYYFLNNNFGYFFSKALENLYHIPNEKDLIPKVEQISNQKLIDLVYELRKEEKKTINILELVNEIIIPLKNEICQKARDLFMEEHKLSDFFNSDLLSRTIFSINLSDSDILDNTLKFERKYASRSLFSNILLLKEENSNEADLQLSTIIRPVPIEEIASMFFSCLSKIVLNPNYNTYCFTAERSAINIFSRELTLLGDKIFRSKDSSLKKFADKRINRYSKPIIDSLDIAGSLKESSEEDSFFDHLAIELEKSLLKGKVSIGNFDDLQYKPKKMDQSLEIHLTSSLVKSLSPLAFYLRHLAQKNDCIIIDEPELNLHPDNQILIARFLGRLVNEGFKVVISTHSDYIIKEINN
ncbi:MAG: hypothetical protein EAZ97_15735, partial [Bacteroidetes bacterium]